MASVSSTKKVANKGLIKTIELKVNCSYQTEDGKLIDKVLDGFATCSIETSEKVGDFLQFAGKMNLTSVYVDTEKQLASERVEASFSEKVQIGDVDATAVVPSIVSVKQRRETSTFVDCTVTLLVEVYGVMQDTIAFIEAGNSEVVEKTKEIESESLLCFNNSSFSLTEEVEVSEQIDRVIASYSSANITKIIPNGNYVEVVGEVVRDIVYVSGELIKKVQKRSDFTQEISLLNCTDETGVSAKIYTSGENFSVDINDEQTKTVLTFNSSMNVALWGFEKSKFNVLSDVYSTTKELEVKRLGFTSVNHLPTVILSETLNENIDMSDSKRIDEIIAMGSNVISLEKTSFVDGELTIVGSINQKVIAKNYDNDDIFSTEVVVPFNCQFKTGLEGSSMLSAPMVTVRCTSFKNKAGKELNLTYEINVMSDVIHSKFEDYISECVELSEKTQSEHSIVIYMPKEDERVFDIAKKLSVTPEVLLAQNPGISDNERIEKVVIFKCAK